MVRKFATKLLAMVWMSGMAQVFMPAAQNHRPKSLFAQVLGWLCDLARLRVQPQVLQAVWEAPWRLPGREPDRRVTDTPDRVPSLSQVS